MAERNAAVGYAAIKKESTPGTAVTPDVYTPYYKQSVATDFHVMEDMPVYGNRFKKFQHLRGTRSHGGQIVVMAEPDTAGYWLDMLLNRSATSGAGPYTHTFGLSNTTLPNSYTLDISLGSQVVRYMGVQASNLNVAWEDEKMQFEIDVSALKSFHGREIASVSGSGPYTVVLKTDYDPSPTDGLVVSDLIQFQLANGTTVNATVASIVGVTSFTCVANPTVSAGDMVVLRPATPSLSIKTPFLWGKTQFFFAADAAAAATASATSSNQTRLEPGTELSIMYEFEDDEGSKRSGSFDPASLIRTVGDYSFKIKKYFDTADDFKKWNALTKQALVMIAYSGSTNQYQLKVTLNNMTSKTGSVETESGATEYQEIEMGGNYDTSDGAGMTVVAINAVSTI